MDECLDCFLGQRDELALADLNALAALGPFDDLVLRVDVDRPHRLVVRGGQGLEALATLGLAAIVESNVDPEAGELNGSLPCRCSSPAPYSGCSSGGRAGSCDPLPRRSPLSLVAMLMAANRLDLDTQDRPPGRALGNYWVGKSEHDAAGVGRVIEAR